MITTDSKEPLMSVLKLFEKQVDLNDVRHSIKESSSKKYLIIYLSEPSERFYEQLRIAVAQVETQCGIPLSATIERNRPVSLIDSPEGRALLRSISASLNVNRYTFNSDFFAHYSQTVFGAEEKIVAHANHIVHGRRGAGKSSLLLFALHRRTEEGLPSAWVDMQTYSHRQDNCIAVDILIEILEQAESDVPEKITILRALKRLRNEFSVTSELSDVSVRSLAPSLRRYFALIVQKSGNLMIFLDDFHAVDLRAQPKVLDFLYSCTRGNRVFLKLSAIETLTNTWDNRDKLGLQIGQDVEALKLDLNLTVPDKALNHISKILDQQAAYCGLPKIKSLATGDNVFNRLVWESAGVPRDALSIFSSAITESVLKGNRRISVNAINVAASSTVELKLRDLKDDASGSSERLGALFESIRDFCIESEKEERHNAFLVEITSETELYTDVRKLVDLRLLHVIHEGVNVGRAGRRFLALILDYGFYVGNRAAKSVQLFNKETSTIKYAELRKLRVFRQN